MDYYDDNDNVGTDGTKADNVQVSASRVDPYIWCYNRCIIIHGDFRNGPNPETSDCIANIGNECPLYNRRSQ